MAQRRNKSSPWGSPGTLEYRRAALTRDHPRTSRAIAVTAVLILLVNLVLAAPVWLEMVTSIPEVADRVGTFTSPVLLPGWLLGTLTVAGVVAAVERAVTFVIEIWLCGAQHTLLSSLSVRNSVAAAARSASARSVAAAAHCRSASAQCDCGGALSVSRQRGCLPRLLGATPVRPACMHGCIAL